MGTSCCVCDSHNNNENIFVFESNEFGTVNSYIEHSLPYGSERLSRDQKIKHYKQTLSSGDLFSNLSTSSKRSDNHYNHYRKSQSMVIPEEHVKDIGPIEKDIQIKLDNDSQCGVNCNNNNNNVKESNENEGKCCLQLPPKAPKKTKATKLKKKKLNNNDNMNSNENGNKCKDMFEKYKYVFDEPTTTTNTQKSRSRSKSKIHNSINSQDNNNVTHMNHVNCLSVQSENSKQPLTEQN